MFNNINSDKNRLNFEALRRVFHYLSLKNLNICRLASKDLKNLADDLVKQHQSILRIDKKITQINIKILENQMSFLGFCNSFLSFSVTIHCFFLRTFSYLLRNKNEKNNFIKQKAKYEEEVLKLSYYSGKKRYLKILLH
jgi:F-box domain